MNYRLFIKKYRILKEMTQHELALKSQVKQSYISQLENNHPKAKSPTLTTIFRIAKALDTCPHMLIEYNINCNNNCLNSCSKKF